MMRGNIFNIQRYTIHDGPGIRTELFLKGCPLSCKWCGNPESRKEDVEPGVYSAKCLGRAACGLCVDACGLKGGLIFGKYTGLKQNGFSENADGSSTSKDVLTSMNRSLCMGCMECVNACPADAIRQWGRWMTVEEAMEVILRDRSYYESSGGGVTVSGGEPLLQADFVTELLRRCKEESIHTCLESTFCVGRDIIEKVLPYTDMLITDIKHMEPEIHRAYTGVSNERILANLRRLAKYGMDGDGKSRQSIIVRIPVIPGFNDTMKNMEATADFIINQMGTKAVGGTVELLQLLSFMRLGEEKYKSLGLPYEMDSVKLNREEFQEKIKGFAGYFNSRGIICSVGTKEKP